jgi:hypothetical protein
MISEAEFARRLPVWTALSDLFLDTELTDADYAQIAGALSASGYGRSELQRILQQEVAPTFGWNLLSVAGEWAPYVEADVAQAMAWTRRGRPGLTAVIMRMILRGHLREEWAKLDARLPT